MKYRIIEYKGKFRVQYLHFWLWTNLFSEFETLKIAKYVLREYLEKKEQEPKVVYELDTNKEK